ncbi:MAG: TetR/AcrR family transcriptional regulator [Phycisphaeraceae bacterium]
MTQVTEKQAYELFGDGQPPQTTRDKLIYRAMDLFYAYGYHAVGIDRILRDVGVTKTTFYNHFKSKDDLILETIRLRDRWESASFARRMEKLAGDDPRAFILGYFEVMHEFFNGEDFEGCQYLNACAEFPSPHDPIHQEAAKHYVNTEAMLRDAADRLGADDPDDLARQITILIEGALTRRLITRDNEAALAAREVAQMLLAGATPRA